MHLLDFPAEVLILIIKQLDIKSQIRLLESYHELQDIIAMFGKIAIQRRELRSASIFTEPSFKLISDQICEIDLTGIKDLTEDVAGVFKTMNNLIKIEISFTNLLLKDIINICPQTVNDITLTLSAEDNILLKNIDNKNLAKRFFQNFQYVHIKLKPDFFDTPDAFYAYVLKGSPQIKEMKVSYLSKTVMAAVNHNGEIGNIQPCFRKLVFSFNFLLPILAAPAIHEFDNTNLEYFIYNFDQKCSKVNVIVSPFVKNILFQSKDKVFFKDNVMKVLPIRSLLDFPFYGQVTFIIWNKKKYNVDQIGHVILDDIINSLPNHICKHEYNEVVVIQNLSNNTYIIHDCKNDIENNITSHTLELNNILLKPLNDVTLVNDCVCGLIQVLEDDEFWQMNQSKLQKRYTFPGNYLNNISSLTLHNVNFMDESWFTLFQNSMNLETLNVIITGNKMRLTNNYEGISKYLPLCKSLRNFRISEKNIDHEIFFKGLSKCNHLEIIELDCVYPVREFEQMGGDEEIPYDIENNIWHVSNSSFIAVLEKCVNLKILVLDNFFRGNKKVRENVQRALQTFAIVQKRADLNIIVSCNAPYINYSSEKECVGDIFYPMNRLLRY